MSEDNSGAARVNVSVNESIISGDLVAGDKYEASLSPLESAIKAIQKELKDDQTFCDFIDDLAEFTTNNPGREIIGLEKKLQQGGRNDEVFGAMRAKNKFEKKLAKGQLFLVEQKVLVHVLSHIYRTFHSKIRPLILSKKDRAEVDAAIYDDIYLPVYKAISLHDTGVTMDHVAGMLYFLTGKCHVTWA